MSLMDSYSEFVHQERSIDLKNDSKLTVSFTGSDVLIHQRDLDDDMIVIPAENVSELIGILETMDGFIKGVWEE